MNSIFSYNNPFTQFAVKLLKLLWLNILWIVFSLPIVTMGASTAALYYTTMRLAQNEEGYLYRDFFYAFKNSFKNSTIFFYLMVIVTIVCYADFFFLGENPIVAVRLLAFFILGFWLFFSFASVYLLPLTVRFQKTVRETFCAALMIASQNLHWSLCLLILNLVLPLVILFKFLPLIVFGIALPIFLQSYILNKIFKKYLPSEEFTPGSLLKGKEHLPKPFNPLEE